MRQWTAEKVEATLGEPTGETFYQCVHLFTVQERLIVDDTIYCSGDWDEATSERWCREALMVNR